MPRSVLIAPVALFAAPIAALIASAPAAARVADEHIAFLAAWPAVAGLVGVPLAGLIAARPAKGKNSKSIQHRVAVVQTRSWHGPSIAIK